MNILKCIGWGFLITISVVLILFVMLGCLVLAAHLLGALGIVVALLTYSVAFVSGVVYLMNIGV